MNKKETKITATINKSDQTPIEVALEIDDDGMTTAKRLYEFLELNPAHYSRWCKRNIIENKFSEENVDYFSLTHDGERIFNPNPTRDFKLTADFAKKLCMTGNSPKHEQARQYFLACEQGLKIASKKMKEQSSPVGISHETLSLLHQTQQQTLTMMTTLTQMVQTLADKQEQQEFKVPYPAWLNTVQAQIDEIHDHYFPDDIKSNGARAYTQTYAMLFREFQDTYDNQNYLNQIVQDFYMEHKVNVPTMTAIAFNPEVRALMETVIENLVTQIREQQLPLETPETN